MNPSGAKEGRTGGKAALRAGIALFVFFGGALVLFFLAPETRYLWVKALHVISVISWMAGLFYLPRLFIYHFESEPGSKQSDTFALMERRLLRIIMNPAMVISWVLGLYVAWDGYGFAGGWLHAKLLAVVALTGTHLYFAKAVESFSRGHYVRDARHWRLMNEIPTILMVVVVILVIVKPF